MNKRKFFKSLVACAAIVFAEPLSLIKPNPKWIVNPDWVDAEYAVEFVGIDRASGEDHMLINFWRTDDSGKSFHKVTQSYYRYEQRTKTTH